MKNNLTTFQKVVQIYLLEKGKTKATFRKNCAKILARNKLNDFYKKLNYIVKKFNYIIF